MALTQEEKKARQAEYHRRYMEDPENRKKVNEYRNAWRADHVDQVREQQATWRKNNPERLKEQRARYEKKRKEARTAMKAMEG